MTTEAEKDLHREAGIMAYMAKVSTEPYPTVRLFGIAVEKPSYALVMEYVPNGTLFDLLQLHNETKLPWDLRYQLAADIADGIALLHRQHILHRDLRSHNILLNINEGRLRAKLSDFGLSTVKSSIRTYSTVTKKTENAGARAWMAPELHKRGGQSSPASDIYSYGMVLWELLTHATPFVEAQGDSSLITDWVVKDRVTETITDDCPPKLAELIKKCWAFKPEDRILMDDIQKELTELVKTHPLSSQTQAITETLKKSQGEREEKWNARRQVKRRDAEQMQEGYEVEIKKQVEIDRLQQQHQAKQLALQKQMEELKLAQEQQLQAAAEEKRRLEAEKQAEIKRLKQQNQQHQLKLKHPQDDLKRQTQVQPPKSTPPLPPVSQTYKPRFMPKPQPKASPAQLTLQQDQLIAACKQGDEKAVKVLLQQGAKPDIANANGEQPLGAAVWGMCPDIVNALLTQTSGIVPMTWSQCEQHNLKHYKEVFIFSKFDPQTYKEWHQLLLKMEPNPFIRALHLKEVDEESKSDYKNLSSWVNLKKYVSERLCMVDQFSEFLIPIYCSATENRFVSYRAQIRIYIKHAKQPIEQQSQVELKKSISETEPVLPLSQNPYGLTTPDVDQKALSQLLQYVAEGEQDKAEALIQKNKKLLLHAGTVKDLSDREFKQITAFQYALWAMDWHMWTMIRKYLPQKNASRTIARIGNRRHGAWQAF